LSQGKHKPLRILIRRCNGIFATMLAWGGTPKSPKVAKRSSRVAGPSRFSNGVKSSRVHMLIVACDYKNTEWPLTSTVDAKHIEELARACNVHNIISLYDNQCTRFGILAALETIGGKCRDVEDFFIFYFAGHGIQLDDADYGGPKDPNYVDVVDEAFVCVDENGKFNHETILRDDDFAVQLTLCFPKETRMLILTDSCHSATMCDMGMGIWNGRQAAHIAGCLDEETAGDIGRGGVFSHAMLLALQKLVEHEIEVASVAKVYNAIVHEAHETFNGAQEITLNLPPHFSATELPWPLIPPRGYKAPLNKAINYSKAELGSDSFRQQDDSHLNKDHFEMHNVRASLVRHAKNGRAAHGNQPKRGKAYLDHVEAEDCEDWRPGETHCRSCSNGCSVQ